MAIHQNEADVEKIKGAGHWVALFRGLDNRLVAGFCLGVSEYDCGEYPEPGVHEDQEGFYVISGQGMARVGDEEIELKPGTVFLAGKGVPHAIKRTGDAPVKVIWAHGAV